MIFSYVWLTSSDELIECNNSLFSALQFLKKKLLMNGHVRRFFGQPTFLEHSDIVTNESLNIRPVNGHVL